VKILNAAVLATFHFDRYMPHYGFPQESVSYNNYVSNA